jgi:vacuolar-type H+-ATPase subunit I/STV1
MGIARPRWSRKRISEVTTMKRLWPAAILALPLALACTSAKEKARADTAQALAAQQKVLMAKLEAQKDSLTQVVGDADSFIAKIDSQVSRVKGLPKSKKNAKSESPIQDQLQARKDMLKRVNALVERAQETAKELADARKREEELRGENTKLQAQVDADALRIAELTSQIEQQAQSIALMQAKVDTLDMMVNELRATQSKVYYVIGDEGELIKKGIVVKEGGANLLIARVGRTLVPARTLDRDLFKSIDTREIHEIPVPDSTRQYQIVSRQSLDNADVVSREGSSFRGNLKIKDSDRFWGPSKYLIIVQK